MKNKKNLAEALDGYIAPEIIDGYNCSACQNQVQIEKRSSVKSLPNTLVIHLQRIEMDYETFRNKKIDDKLEFPNQLNMRKYMLSSVLQESTQKNKDDSAQAAAQKGD